MSRKIFFGNYKGGVGKTTTVFEIGALLASEHNKKVLLVDLDPQCSLSKICTKISDIDMAKIPTEESLNFIIELYGEYINNTTRLNILEGEINSNRKYINNAVKPIKKYTIENKGTLDFIPTVLDMKNARLNDISERLSKNPIGILAISKILSDIEREYDYIFFDCPPTSNVITQGVFLASDYYFIPTIGDEISSDGVSDYITEIESTYLKYAYDNSLGGLVVKKYFGSKPELIGVLITIYKNRSSSNDTLAIAESLDNSITAIGIKSKVENTTYVAEGRKHIFKSRIRNLDNRSNPNDYGIPITLSNGNIHDEYREITEILNNILKE